jgi:hypothetical protein
MNYLWVLHDVMQLWRIVCSSAPVVGFQKAIRQLSALLLLMQPTIPSPKDEIDNQPCQ